MNRIQIRRFTHTLGKRGEKNQEEMGVEGKVVIDDMRERVIYKKKEKYSFTFPAHKLGIYLKFSRDIFNDTSTCKEEE